MTLAAALRLTLTATATQYADQVVGEQHVALRQRLLSLTRLSERPLAIAFQQAVEQAVVQLRDQHAVSATIDQMVFLLAAATPAASVFRQRVLEELVLSSKPNGARLHDVYRGDLYRELASRGRELPSWTVLAPMLHLFLAKLLPQTLSEQPTLRRCLLDQREREQFAALQTALAQRTVQRPLEQVLGDEHQQQIIATDGATIAQVQQTIVQGDFYAAPTAPSADLEGLYRRYVAFVQETFGTLDFRGILQLQHVTRLPLEAIYVPLTGQIATDAQAVPVDSWALVVGRDAPLHTIVRDTPLLVVLGHPGAGKSTLVRFLMLMLARGENETALGLPGAWLPIFFPVAAYAEARAVRPDLAPFDYLRDYYLGLSQPDYTPLFARALQLGRALVLLDGLDEARSDRLGLTRTLEALVRGWERLGNRFIATSRVAGYDDAPLDPRLFACVTIAPFDNDQIASFASRWAQVYEQGAAGQTNDSDPTEELERRINERSDRLCEEVFATPGVTELARTPLLLTILALIQNQGAHLPDRRSDLYRLCVEALAETWNRARSLSGREIDVYLGGEKLSERFVINVLGPTALWMHSEHPEGLVEQRDLEQHLTTTLIQADGLTRGRAQRLAQSFIELMRRDTGLLHERGHRLFGFLHQTFQEYLAARALLESVTVDNPDSLLDRHATDPRWREVIRLAVAAASQREAQRLLLRLLNAASSPELHGRSIVLAGECLADIGRNGSTQRAWSAVLDRLIDLLEEEELPLATRVAAGHVLGRLGDPRLLDRATGRSLLSATRDGGDCGAAHDYWCAIGAGCFWYGDERAGNVAEMQLPHGFRIARFPVTNAEYRAFVEAGGYREREWWTPNGWEFLRPGNHRSPLEASNRPITRPGLWDVAQFSGASQPVVGVSWYEASAYCAWLTAWGRRAGWLALDEVLRLPTSVEWERAARHRDQRRYPWGDDLPSAERANFYATGLRAPAPVGCFPHGAAACGARDLAGNVWEWTASQHEQAALLEPQRDVALTDQPVIRGGAFNWEADYLACGAHYWFNPGHRHNLLGFRVVWARN
jgi:formylglycine-generating enzyme required for sulfatase activity/energy-coupling factor transporter ATP-binding protein EcfA2